MILNKINEIKKIRGLSVAELKELCKELREETIKVVSQTGGHLGAGLGVVELTVAIHHVFNTPEDLLIFDVGHQSYPHKILTGRRDKMNGLRQGGGLAGFTKRDESIFDPFGAGHSSTSISAALGMAVARDLNCQNKDVIALIGDGAISAGMAYEAMNNAGYLGKRLIVILNDNDMSIAPPVGAMSSYLSRLISSKPYLSFRNFAKQVVSHLPEGFEKVAKKAELYAKNITGQSNLFEELGFYYIGPIDGHNLDDLVAVLKNIKEDHTLHKPILVHAITEKGKGFVSPEASSEKYHAVNKFCLDTKLQKKNSAKTYTKLFAECLIQEAGLDEKIVAITAAMPSGTGLDLFGKQFPNRTFDVGIAEQHAVTFAAGLACEGIKPVVAIYSTFLQRAYDQIVHDVVLQNLPVRFAIDRAGFVGADGPTHAGSFDTAYLGTLPNIVLMAASDATELQSMIKTSLSINDRPSAFRYPRGEAITIFDEQPTLLEIGKGRVVKKGTKIAILSYGARLADCLEAAKEIKEEFNIDITIADARFAKPLDTELIKDLVETHQYLISIEEGSIGGFGSYVADYLIRSDLIQKVKFTPLYFPDCFMEQDSPENMYKQAGLDYSSIKQLVSSMI